MADQPAPHPLTPSTSTVVSGSLGLAVALIVSWVLDVILKVQMPAEVQTALGVVISTSIGYFATGGKAIDTF